MESLYAHKVAEKPDYGEPVQVNLLLKITPVRPTVTGHHTPMKGSQTTRDSNLRYGLAGAARKETYPRNPDGYF